MTLAQPTSRSVALSLLDKTLHQGADLAWLLEKDKYFPKLSKEDQRFCFLLVMTALRWHGVHRKVLAHHLQKPLPKKSPVELILMLGLASREAGVPEHALVHTAVELARQLGFESHTGLINGVLRNSKRENILKNPIFADPIHNLPHKMRKRWEEAYGRATVELFAAAHLIQPPTDIQFKDGNAADWAEKLEGTVLAAGTLRLDSARALTTLAGFSEGAWWVQDVAASLPALMLGDVNGKDVLDLCAAPGGKTMQLCARGGVVTAVEKSKTRIQTLKENMQRLGFAPIIVEQDVMKYTPEQQFDAILLDAPCSATGTLRRNPDIAWKRTHRDILELAVVQYAMLEHAFTLLKPGGTLVYSVCSLEPEEGESLVSRFLAAHSDATLKPVTEGEAGIDMDWLTPRGELRTLPHFLYEQGGMDGFYAARLVKA